MERRKSLCLTGAVLALGMASLPATAQQTTTTQTTTTTRTTVQTNNDRISSMRNDMYWDKTLPSSPAQSKMILLQMMSEKDFGKADLVKAIPLLMDLRDAEMMYQFGMEDAASYWATLPDQSKVNGMDEVRNSANGFRDKREAIWRTLGESIGQDKAASLRPLVEPMRVDVNSYAYNSSHLQRIDQLIRDWDAQAAARVAAAGGAAPNNTANTVSVETTTTTTDTIPGLEIYTFPSLTAADIVDVMQMRLAALEAEGMPEAIIAIRGHDLHSNDIRFLREKHLKYWD